MLLTVTLASPLSAPSLASCPVILQTDTVVLVWPPVVSPVTESHFIGNLPVTHPAQGLLIIVVDVFLRLVAISSVKADVGLV